MARQHRVPVERQWMMFRGRRWNTVSWTFAMMLALMAVMTAVTLLLRGINTMLDAADGQVTLSVAAQDPSTAASLAPAPPSGATAHILSATIAVDPASLTPLAMTLILGGTWCWILAAICLLALVVIVGWRLFEGTLLVALPRRPVAWLSTAAVIIGAIATVVHMMGTNTALRDLGYASPAGDIGYVGNVIAFSPWIWIAVLWAIIFLGQAWRMGRALAWEAEGLV